MATARMTLGCAVCALLPAYATLALAEEASSAADVRVSVDGQPPRPMREGEALSSGSLVSTGAAPRVVLRFPDGQRVLLGPRTQLRIVDYRFGREAPQADRALFELAAGTARFVTGELAARSRDVLAVATPHVTLGVRGTDFLVAAGSRTYLQVLQGAVDAHSGSGALLFEPGTYGAVAADRAFAAVIAADMLPPAVAEAFRRLAAAP